MNAIITLIAIELLAVLLLLPIKVNVQGYFSLTTVSAGIDLKIFRLTILKIRLKSENCGIMLALNGKRLPLKDIKEKLQGGKFSKEKAVRAVKGVLTTIKSGEMGVMGGLVAVIGDSDPFVSSVVCGALMSVLRMIGAKVSVYSDLKTQRADGDLRFGARISLVQVITAVL